LFGWSFADRLEQLIEARCESGPEAAHFESPAGAGAGQGVVFAGMSKTRLDPFGLDQTRAFEASEERIDGAFGDDESGAVFEAAQHLQAIKATGPESGEGGQFHASLAQLDLPFIGGSGDHFLMVRTGVAYSQESCNVHRF
jgi:hypothetical protein